MWDRDIKHFMTIWLEDDDANQIKTLLDGQDFVMFFKKDKYVYGASEDGRLVFAKMKHPDEEVNKDWLKEATFMAVNLTKALDGDKVHSIFTKADLKKIKVIDREVAEKTLISQIGKTVKANEIPPKKHDDMPVGTIQIKDKAK